MNIIGIDPGKNGGIAQLHWDFDAPCVYKMPATLADTYATLHGFATEQCKAYIEKVGAMPKQGVSSTFKFGQNYGALEMALTALHVPFDRVLPRTWQKALGIAPRGKTESKTNFKNRLKARAQELFPTIKMSLAICDALLIAEYGRRLEAR